MATTTASKGGLRANASAKRTKAAQRTPLPSKDHAENIALAQEAVEEAKPATRAKAPAKRAPGRAEARAELLAEKPPAKRAKAGTPEFREEQIAAGMERKRGRRAAEDATPEPEPEEPQDKGARYADLLAEAGWDSVTERTDGLVELVANRGVEALFLSWLNEAHISGGSTYTYADRTVKVRNPAEAMRIAARTPEEAKASQAKVSDNKQFRKRATGPTVRRVTIDVATATDAEIIAAIEGHEIQWHSPYRVESESAIVGSAKGITVKRHARGHRIVSFVDPQSGFRAFALENLENIGRKVNLDRIKQEILNSITKDQGKKK